MHISILRYNDQDFQSHSTYHDVSLAMIEDLCGRADTFKLKIDFDSFKAVVESGHSVSKYTMLPNDKPGLSLESGLNYVTYEYDAFRNIWHPLSQRSRATKHFKFTIRLQQ